MNEVEFDSIRITIGEKLANLRQVEMLDYRDIQEINDLCYNLKLVAMHKDKEEEKRDGTD